MNWYEDDIRQVEVKLKAHIESPSFSVSKPVVFYGSSSIRLWSTLANDFPELNTLNLGFGGSTLASCAWFFERVVVPASPSSILFYAGDNDLGDGRHPEEVYLFFCAFAQKVRQSLPGVPLTFLSIKASPARWNIVDKIRATNRLIADEIEHLPNCHYVDMTSSLLNANGTPRRELFEGDGLHLNPSGYQVWKQTLHEQLAIV